MKKKALNSRLSINKTTIARLSAAQAASLAGGGTVASWDVVLSCAVCAPTRANSCRGLCIPETGPATGPFTNTITGPIL
ncbi:class I lanthipeptide [Chitinophaga pendula]|uniref:class I lanthipeptide n=1 Tax=Chitinophaga TaxID=79328 RepID=UPI0012FD0886|nr:MULTISPECIES: class I lanthipeptide [Chitinophaga]UCJ09509.1 class I lanthipeptide [Chitinophaga pendula]